MEPVMIKQELQNAWRMGSGASHIELQNAATGMYMDGLGYTVNGNQRWKIVGLILFVLS